MKSKNKVVVVLIVVLSIVCILVTYLFISGMKIKIKEDISLNFEVEENIRKALYYASLAPTSHNTQNWKVYINPDEKVIKVKLDEDRLLPKVDPNNREALIGIGTFIYTLEYSLNNLGYDTELEVNDDMSDILVATIKYDNNNTSINTDNLSIIEKRHTDKSTYSKEPINEQIITLLKNNNKNIFYFDNTTEKFNIIVDNNLKAMTQQSYTEDKQKELAEWLRFSNKEALEKKDGLPAEQLGLSGPIKPLYYMFTKREDVVGENFIESGLDIIKKQSENAAGYFVIVGEDNKVNLVDTGMLLQEFWLTAAENNVSIQPISQIIEEEPFNSIVKEQLGVDAPMQMILRAGYVKNYGENNKIRVPISEFVFLEE